MTLGVLLLGVLAVAVLLFVIFRGNDGDAKPDEIAQAGIFVSSGGDGDAWPFTLDSGYLYSDSKGAAIFKSGDTEYGLNGTAKERGYIPVDSIWRADPRSTTGVMKINIGPYIEKALANPE